MSYQVDSACYDTAAQAAQASASKSVGGVVNHGGSAYVVNAASVDSDSITYTLSPVGGGATITVDASYNAQPCNLLTYQDGAQLGWMVGAAWIAAYAVLFIARAVRGETGGEYGNA